MVLCLVIFVAATIVLLLTLSPEAANLPYYPTAGYRSRHPIQYALSYLGPAFAIVTSMFAFLGQNWARWLLLGFLGWRVVITALYLPWTIALFTALVFFSSIYYLFRPAANAFFRGEIASRQSTPRIDDAPTA